MDSTKAKLTHEIQRRDKVIERLGKEINRQRRGNIKLLTYLVAFSLLVVVYFLLEWIK